MRSGELNEKFRSRFGAGPSLFRAPGRVNLIGEHTDYNDGFVFPAAIDLFTWVALSPRKDRLLVVFSENLQEQADLDLDRLGDLQPRHWSTYIGGVAAVLEKTLDRNGSQLRGANLLIFGDVPLGAGLSSSASLEVAVGYALLENSSRDLDRRQLALACQRAENDFVGTRCGIMDQLASACGVMNHAILLDCRTLDFRAVPIPNDLRLVICNTMVPRQLSRTAYNARREECEAGVRALKSVYPEIRALRDVNMDQLETHPKLMSETVFKRCRHVITEIDRTLRAAKALEQNHFQELGRAMAESHRSLRDDFEVSCAELDLLVSLAEQSEGVVGARMTGAGFGGCTINLVHSGSVEAFQEKISQQYEVQTGWAPEIYVCSAADGVGRTD